MKTKKAIIKKIISGDLILAHGTNKTIASKVVEEFCLGGGSDQVWNVSDEWVYFWSSYGIFAELQYSTSERDFLEEIKTLDKMYKDLILKEGWYSEESVKKIKDYWEEKIPLQARERISEEILTMIVNMARESGNFSITEKSSLEQCIFIFDGEKLEGVEIDLSCPSRGDYIPMAAAARVISPVALEKECGYIGMVKCFEPDMDLFDEVDIISNYCMAFEEGNLSEYGYQYVKENLFRIYMLKQKLERKSGKIRINTEMTPFLSALDLVKDELFWGDDEIEPPCLEDMLFYSPKESSMEFKDVNAFLDKIEPCRKTKITVKV